MVTHKPKAMVAPKGVLIVEDEPTIYRSMCLLLKHYKYNVTHAGTIADALAQIKAADGRTNKPFDFILLDLMLSDGDGEQVLQHIRRIGYPSHVSVITAVGDERRLNQLKEWSPNLVLRKPIDFLQLLGLLEPTA